MPNRKSLTLDIQDHIATIELSRPDELNTMNLDFWREFPEAVRQADHSGDARVLILQSTGKHFTAGMDLSVFTDGSSAITSTQGDPSRAGEAFRRVVLELQAVFNTLEQVRIPVLAAIHGGCIGGGVDMICACDCRYATEDAFFSIKETQIGMTADVGTLQRLPHLIPQGMVRELAYTGARLPAARAYELGLVNRLFKDRNEMISGVREIAGEIAANSPLAVAGSKEMITYARDHTVADSLNYIATWQAGMFSPQDMMQTFAAKSTGNPPEFPPLEPMTKKYTE